MTAVPSLRSAVRCLLMLCLITTAAWAAEAVPPSSPEPAGMPLLESGLADLDVLALSPDGGLLATPAYGLGVDVWETGSQKRRRTLTAPVTQVLESAFSANGARLAACGGTRGGSGAWVWEVATGRLLQSWQGREARSVNFTSDGKALVTAVEADGRTVVLREVGSGAARQRFAVKGPPSAVKVQEARLSADGRILVTFETAARSARETGGGVGGAPGVVRVWEVNGGALRRSLRPGGVAALALSADGKLLAVSGVRGGGRGSAQPPTTTPWGPQWGSGQPPTTTIWEAQTGKLRRTLPDDASSLTFSPDGKTLVRGRPGSLTFWEVSSGKLKRKAAAGSEGVRSITFSRDGRVMAEGESEGEGATIRIWDAKAGRVKTTFSCGASREPLRFEALGISPDAKWLGAAGSDRTIRYWDLRTGTLARTEIGEAEAHGLAYAPQGGLIAVAFRDSVELRDVATGQLTRRLDTGGADVMSLLADTFPLAFSPDGTLLATGGGMTGPNAPGDLQLWDTRSGALVRRLSPGFVVAFSPDGKTLAVGAWSKDLSVDEQAEGELVVGAVRLYDVASGTQQHLLVGEQLLTPLSLAFSPDGKLVVAGTRLPASAAAATLVWDATTGERVRTLPGEVLLDIVGGKLLTREWSREGNALHVYDPGTGKLERTLARRGLLTAVAPARPWLIVAADHGIEVVDLTTGQVLVTLLALGPSKGKLSREWIAFTPQGHYTGSPEMGPLFRWRVGEELVSTDEYDARFHRRQPEVVEKALSGAK